MGDAGQTLLMSLDTPLVWLQAKSSFTVGAIPLVTLSIGFVHTSSACRHAAWRSLVLGGVASQLGRLCTRLFSLHSRSFRQSRNRAADFLFCHMFYLSKPNLIELCTSSSNSSLTSYHLGSFDHKWHYEKNGK